MKRISFLFIFFVASCAMFARAIKAQDNPARASAALRAMAVSNATHSGSSPFTPPAASDTTFVVDAGAGLDTGCTFNSGGPLIITFNIGRVLGVTSSGGTPSVADIQKLISQNVVAKYTHIAMPAYDVDYYAVTSGYQPERDIVKINGHTVQAPSEYLTGLDNTWVMNGFDAPTEWLNFPADPGSNGIVTPASNTVEIDIDTANPPGSDYWCTSIDWVAASIGGTSTAASSTTVVRPKVFVHGIFSDGGTWNDNTDGISWVNELNAAGVLTDNSLNMGSLDTIGNNAAKIASKVTELEARWGVDSVDLVTHSKGGLDSREYVEKNTGVDKLVQIGTPNAGSPLADVVEASGVLLGGGVGTYIANELAGGLGGLQLTRPYMAVYNLLYEPNADVTYITAPGFYHSDSTTGTAVNLLIDIVGDGDTIVPVTSVPLAYATNLNPVESIGLDTQARHAKILGATVSETNSPGFYSLLSPFLLEGETRTSNAQVARGASGSGVPTGTPVVRAEAAARFAKRSAVPQATASPARTWTNIGTIQQGSTQSGTIPVDAGSSVSFMLLYPSGDVDLTLTSPSGIVYTSAAAVNNPAVTFQKGSIVGGFLAAYNFTTAETGNWSYKITGTNVTQTGGMGYTINALIYGSQVGLVGGFVKQAIHSGETLTLQATLANGAGPLTGATVNAKILLPDGTTSSVALHDDGSAGDAVQNDGIYSANFTQTTQSGNYSIVYQASGSAPAFQREDFELATVAASSSSFSGTFTGAVADTDGDGLYNQLNIAAGVKITKSATYRVVGTLTDSGGNMFFASTEKALATSDSSVTLSFDGSALYANGVNGPYTLSQVTLAEVTTSALMVDDQKTNAFTTAAYKASSFQHPTLAVTGSGTATGVDTNNNKLFDQLNVTFGVIATTAGSYQWSGRLTDKDGIGITLASNSGTMAAGTNTLTLSFSGSDIGSHGVNGPYQLNDLVIYGTKSSSSQHVFTTQNFAASQFEGFTTVKQISTATTLSLISPASGTAAPGTRITVSSSVQPTQGTGTPTGTVTYTVDGTPQTPVTVVNGLAPLTITLAGGTHTVASAYSGDTDYGASTSSTLSLVVSTAATSVTLTPSSTSFPYTSSISLKAVVSSSVAGAITGTVTFNLISAAGTTALGTANLTQDAGGVYSGALSGVTFQSAGSYTVSASYGGNASFAASTSSTVTLTVLGKGDLTLANVPDSVTITYGGKSAYALPVTTTNALTDAVTVSCAGMPGGSSCQFTVGGSTTTGSVTLYPDAGGHYPASLQMTVIAPATRASADALGHRIAFAAVLPWFGSIGLLVLIGRRRKTATLLAVLFTALSFEVVGCGGSSPGPVTGTATLNVTSAGASTINHTYTFTVTLR